MKLRHVHPGVSPGELFPPEDGAVVLSGKERQAREQERHRTARLSEHLRDAWVRDQSVSLPEDDLLVLLQEVLAGQINVSDRPTALALLVRKNQLPGSALELLLHVPQTYGGHPLNRLLLDQKNHTMTSRLLLVWEARDYLLPERYEKSNLFTRAQAARITDAANIWHGDKISWLSLMERVLVLPEPQQEIFWTLTRDHSSFGDTASDLQGFYTASQLV